MKWLVNLYKQQFKTTFAMMLQYRAALLIWMIGHVLEPLIYLIVWPPSLRRVAAASVIIQRGSLQLISSY